jgi:hypothetical protein
MVFTHWLHFLNLQYWYCVIYSTFGGKCTYPAEVVVKPTGPQGQGAFTALLHTLSAGILTFWHAISGVASWLWHYFSIVAYSYSALAGFAIASALAGLIFVWMRELGVYGTLPPAGEKDDSRMKRWKELLGLAMTTDPKEWRNAIIEADQMLGEMLGGLKYPGMNTAERMQKLPDNAFSTVPQAWEAHRIKNFLSAGSSDFILTQREAFRVMKLYEQVFEEFKYL